MDSYASASGNQEFRFPHGQSQVKTYASVAAQKSEVKAIRFFNVPSCQIFRRL